MKQKLLNILTKNGKEKLTMSKIIKTSFKITLTYYTCKLLLTQISKNSDFQLIFSNTKLNNYLTKSILPIDYTPTIYMPICILQMIYNESTGSKSVKYHRQYVATDDLGVVSLDWVETESTKGDPLKYQNLEKDEKLFVIMHGLTGGSDTPYIMDIVHTFENIEKMSGYNYLKFIKILLTSFTFCSAILFVIHIRKSIHLF